MATPTITDVDVQSTSQTTIVEPPSVRQYNAAQNLLGQFFNWVGMGTGKRQLRVSNMNGNRNHSGEPHTHAREIERHKKRLVRQQR